jgi:hypothetical protein
MAGTGGVGTDESRGTSAAEGIIWYGPHACQVCGATIIKAARENGGAELEPPDRLMRIFHRGSESSNPDVTYPMVWKPHVHADPAILGVPRVTDEKS